MTVFSPKGGVGKTTSSVNLALALADKGARKVCLVDLDLAFGDVAITMQLFPTHSIEQAVGSEDSIDLAMIEGLLTRHEDSLNVLAAPAHPDVRERVTPLLISRILRALRDGFDYIVVDTSPSFDDATLTALDETDECVVVATLDVPTLKNVKVALETMDMLNIARGHRHLFLNRADAEVGIGVDKVENILGMPVSAQLQSAMDIVAMTNAGTPIVTAQPNHPASRAYNELAAAVTGEPIASPAVVLEPDDRRQVARPVPSRKELSMSSLSERLEAARREAPGQARRRTRPQRTEAAGCRRPSSPTAAAPPTTAPTEGARSADAPAPATRRRRHRADGAGHRLTPEGGGTPVPAHGGVHRSRRTTARPSGVHSPTRSPTGSRSSRRASTPSCSRSSGRTCTTRTWTRPSSTSGCAPRWRRCWEPRTARSATATAPGSPRRSATTSSATARSTRTSATPRSPRSWSTATTTSGSRSAAG